MSPDPIDFTESAEQEDSPQVDFDGVEEEHETEEADGYEHSIREPFDPAKIRVQSWSPTIDLLMTRIKENEIDLLPDFQRSAGIWSNGAQSRLIESVLIRIPLPAFYMDATNDDHLVVIDGLQRLTTLRRFILDQTLRLHGLEFLHDFHNLRFSELPRHFQRRIQETQVTVYLIEKGTPENVKYNIFKRINTGGLPLSPQEIRHALNPGPVTAFLRDLADCQEFRRATAGGVSPKRMVDRECVLRFIAFSLTSFTSYNTRDFDAFLHKTMTRLNEMPPAERQRLAIRFRRSMCAARDIFHDDAFRKRYDASEARRPVNKALFEAWSVGLDTQTDEQVAQLIESRESVRDLFTQALTSDQEFDSSITYGTSDPPKVRKRFQTIQEILQAVLQ